VTLSALGPRDLLLPLADLGGAGDLPRALFARQTIEGGRRVIASACAEREGEPLALTDLDRLGEPVHASYDRGSVRQALLRSGDGLPVLITRSHGGAFEVSVAGSDGKRAQELAEQIAEALRVERRAADPRVPIAFWSGAADGLFSNASARWRRLELPAFAEIEANYPRPLAERLGELAAMPDGSALPGRLALWHGAPGTGKTWALRALGREWRDWCDLHYITDPERLLGGDTGYMLDVLAGISDDLAVEDDDESPPAEPRSRDKRWRLLVLEDAGELIGVGAPAEVGRAFARLLNIVDGLLGQGTRALILVTTNEPLGRLHPAVLRPGRAMAQLEFTPLSSAEASAWLNRRGVDRKLDSPATIAELHALAAGTNASNPSPSTVGFG
jgi:hypothetical protein